VVVFLFNQPRRVSHHQPLRSWTPDKRDQQLKGAFRARFTHRSSGAPRRVLVGSIFRVPVRYANDHRLRQAARAVNFPRVEASYGRRTAFALRAHGVCRGLDPVARAKQLAFGTRSSYQRCSHHGGVDRQPGLGRRSGHRHRLVQAWWRASKARMHGRSGSPARLTDGTRVID